MHKIVTIRYRNRPLHFIAGPYVERVPGTLGMKLAAEIKAPCDIDMPTRDFGVWPRKEFEDGLVKAITLAMAGELIYIGCMLGQGRTGTVVASLFRTLSDSEEDPIAWTRRTYNPHAVETEEQEELVYAFDVQRIHNALSLDPDGKVTIEEMLARFGLFVRRRTTWLLQRLGVKSA